MVLRLSSGMASVPFGFVLVRVRIRSKKNTYCHKVEHPRARNDYNEEAAYESYMNPEPGFQSGPGDSSDAD